MGGAVALTYQKFDDPTKTEVCREYLETIKQFPDGRSYHVPGEFVSTKGMKAEEQCYNCVPSFFLRVET